jgi:hypothetical protein
MLGVSTIGLLLTVGCVALIVELRDDPSTPTRTFLEFAGYVGAVLFGVCTVVIVWRLLRQRGPVITVTPEGIRDTRVAAEEIPWRAITEVSTWRYRGQKIIILAVDPTVESRLTLTRIARWSRGPNRLLGIDGLCIAVTGLDTSFDALLWLCMDAIEKRGHPG